MHPYIQVADTHPFLAFKVMCHAGETLVRSLGKTLDALSPGLSRGEGGESDGEEDGGDTYEV